MRNWFRNWTVDKLIIVSTTLCVLAEVVINFITSYQHIYDLGLKYGEFGVDARLMPVGIDLMLLAFAEVNLFLSRRGRKSFWMRLGLAVGVLGTVLANAAYGAAWGRTGASLAFWSPLALFATVEAGMMLLRVAAEDSGKRPGESPSGPSRAIWTGDKEYEIHPDTQPPGLAAQIADLAPAYNAALREAGTEVQGTYDPQSGTRSLPDTEGKAPSPPLNTEAWRGLSGIGLQNREE